MNRILFIDDEEEILKSYKRIFEKKSASSDLMELASGFFDEEDQGSVDTSEMTFDVSVANQGLDGVELVKTGVDEKMPYRVAFIDMRMPPGINGLETAKKIREIDPKIEIVIVTAYSDISFKDIALELGAPDKLLYLKKPFDAQEIKQFANNLVVKHKNELIKDDFISNVSHELKTPLSSIIGFHSLLEGASELSEDSKEYLGYIGHSARLMNSLISELLLTLEFQKSELNLNRVSCQADLFFERCYKLLEPLAASKKDITYNYHCSDEAREKIIEIDELRIEQCFNNLVNNAFKFTKEGEINVSLSCADGTLILEVADTGLGIAEDKIQTIFEKFSRVEDKHHEVEGLGLGLSIVKTIMDKHEAKLHVESELTKGSKFQLKFTI